MNSDIRTLSRRAAALVLPLGPLVLGLSVLAAPSTSSAKAEKIVDAASAHHGREDLSIWLSVLGVFVIVPSILAAARLARRGAPRLAAWGVALGVPGYIALYLTPAADVPGRLASATDHDAAVRIGDAMTKYPPMNAAVIVFIVGHTVAVILLGAALLRTRVIPAWAAWLVIVSQPLAVVGYGSGAATVAAAALGLNAVGFAMAAQAVLRLSNGEWDVATRSGTAVAPSREVSAV